MVQRSIRIRKPDVWPTSNPSIRIHRNVFIINVLVHLKMQMSRILTRPVRRSPSTHFAYQLTCDDVSPSHWQIRVAGIDVVIKYATRVSLLRVSREVEIINFVSTSVLWVYL